MILQNDKAAIILYEQKQSQKNSNFLTTGPEILTIIHRESARDI